MFYAGVATYRIHKTKERGEMCSLQGQLILKKIVILSLRFTITAGKGKKLY